MPTAEQNQKRMALIRAVHNFMESPDLEKQRKSKDNIGLMFGRRKEITIKSADIDGMYCEWTSDNHAHIKKHVIFYCHGGGYMSGSSFYARTVTTKLATTTLQDVFCFDYRLSPQHPYPAALDDAVKAWDYIMRWGYGARDVIIAGDSAGGNLALALTLRLREEGRMMPRGLVLLSPWTDLTCNSDSYESKKDLDPILNRDYIETAAKNYMRDESSENPYISPLFADFHNFPPVYIQVGSNEILLDDSFKLHKKLIESNVFVKMDVFDGMWHVFQMSPFKQSTEAMEKIVDFIGERLI